MPRPQPLAEPLGLRVEPGRGRDALAEQSRDHEVDARRLGSRRARRRAGPSPAAAHLKRSTSSRASASGTPASRARPRARGSRRRPCRRCARRRSSRAAPADRCPVLGRARAAGDALPGVGRLPRRRRPRPRRPRRPRSRTRCATSEFGRYAGAVDAVRRRVAGRGGHREAGVGGQRELDRGAGERRGRSGARRRPAR